MDGKLTYVDSSTTRHSQSTSLTPFNFTTSSSRIPRPDRSFPIPTIPDFDGTVLTACSHVSSACARVYTETYDRTQVC